MVRVSVCVQYGSHSTSFDLVGKFAQLYIVVFATDHKLDENHSSLVFSYLDINEM